MALVLRNLPANARESRDMGTVPGSGRSPGVGNGNSLHYSCPENSMGTGAWWATLHRIAAAAAAKSLQSCLTLCDPIDGSPPGSSVPGILQARTLEWVAISFPNAWKWKMKGKSLSRVWLFVTLGTAAYHAPLSTGFPRQEYWSGLPLPSPIELLSWTQLSNWVHIHM